MHGLVAESLRRLALRTEIRGGWSHLPAEERRKILHAASNPEQWQEFLSKEKSWSFGIRRELSLRLVDWIPRLDEVFDDEFTRELVELQVEPNCELEYLTLDCDKDSDDGAAGRKRSEMSVESPNDSGPYPKRRKQSEDGLVARGRDWAAEPEPPLRDNESAKKEEHGTAMEVDTVTLFGEMGETIEKQSSDSRRTPDSTRKEQTVIDGLQVESKGAADSDVVGVGQGTGAEKENPVADEADPRRRKDPDQPPGTSDQYEGDANASKQAERSEARKDPESNMDVELPIAGGDAKVKLEDGAAAAVKSSELSEKKSSEEDSRDPKVRQEDNKGNSTGIDSKTVETKVTETATDTKEPGVDKATENLTRKQEVVTITESKEPDGEKASRDGDSSNLAKTEANKAQPDNKEPMQIDSSADIRTESEGLHSDMKAGKSGAGTDAVEKKVAAGLGGSAKQSAGETAPMAGTDVAKDKDETALPAAGIEVKADRSDKRDTQEKETTSGANARAQPPGARDGEPDEPMTTIKQAGRDQEQSHSNRAGNAMEICPKEESLVGTEELIGAVVAICRTIERNGELGEQHLARRAQQDLTSLKVSDDVKKVEGALARILRRFEPAIRRFLGDASAQVKRLFGEVCSPTCEQERIKTNQRRERKKFLRDKFLAECTAIGATDFEDRAAFVRTSLGTTLSILGDELDQWSSPEYSPIENGALRRPKLPPRTDDGPVSARVTDLLFSNGILQRNVLTMDRLRTMRGSASGLPLPFSSELVIRDHDYYHDGQMIGVEYTRNMLTKAVAVVLEHGGFVASSISVLDILTNLTEKFIEGIGCALSRHRTRDHDSQRQTTRRGGLEKGKNGSVTRRDTVSVAELIAASGFRGGFADLVHYKEQEINLVSVALREAEARVKRKVVDWAKNLAAASERAKVRMAGHSGDLTELERVFLVFPDNVRLPLSDDMPSEVPRKLAQKVMNSPWPQG